MTASKTYGTASEPTSDWRTPAEIGDYRSTPDYAETVAYLERLAATFPDRVRIEDFGRTGEGRDLKIVIASNDGVFDPAAIHASGRVILLVQNAIHAGEMDGKDACLALLRDMLRDEARAKLLQNVVFVFIPVYNLDGHERRSAHGRINQNGPELFGWRANGTNLNLNRDYMKADAPETRAFLRMFHRWLPDFFVDDHVTDGADFEYDVTFALDATPDVFPATAAWIREAVTPDIVRRVNATGHLAFPDAVFLRDDTDPARGLAYHDNPPRFSTGQMILENRPGLLVELHMLKDYRTRVTGNYELLVALLEVLNRDAARLVALNSEADRAAVQIGGPAGVGRPFPLVLGTDGTVSDVEFRGVEFARSLSEVSGTVRIEYGRTARKMTLSSEVGSRVEVAVPAPAGYILPPQWTEVIEVLAAHAVAFRRTTAPWSGTVERYRLSGMAWPSSPFEGRFPILRGGNVEREMGHFGECVLSSETLTFPAGSVVVPLEQRLSKVVIHWLEPAAPDSALRWGFFAPIFEQKEYGEAYVLERFARDEMARDPALAVRFQRRIETDPGFARSPNARLAFFYDRSPWSAANRVGEYPVGRLLSLEGLPLD